MSSAGIFHHFHHAWIEEISRALNRGLLPPDHYALAEQIKGGLGPDVLALQGPVDQGGVPQSSGRTVALAVAPPKVWFHAKTEIDVYAAKARAIAIRHTSDHRVVAFIEIVSPGNKSNRHGLRAFVDQAVELLRAGIHVLIVDLFPPSPRDPQGIHRAVWDEFVDNDFALPTERSLTLASYIGGLVPEAFVEATAVGMTLPDLALFLNPEHYVQVPLEATYQSAWDAVPSFWRNVVTLQPKAF